MEIIRHLTNEELTDLALASDQQSLRLEIEALPEWSCIPSRQTDFGRNSEPKFGPALTPGKSVNRAMHSYLPGLPQQP